MAAIPCYSNAEYNTSEPKLCRAMGTGAGCIEISLVRVDA
jgi:hypothetical protein